MAGYPSDTLVRVRPFDHRPEGDTVIIGDLERQVFLSIPAEGLDLLQSLAAGRSVGEAVRLYEEKYAETPDITDFLDALGDEGFIEIDEKIAAAVAGPVAAADPARRPRRSYSLNWLSPTVARRLVSLPVLIACVLVIATGVYLATDDPNVLPTPGETLLFPIHFAALTWATFILTLVGVAIHEAAHMVAARAAGVPSRLVIGNQLYVLVVQTDMSGIWLAPRRQRFVAFIAGTLIDGVLASSFVLALWANRHSFLNLPEWVALLLTALLFTYLVRIIWQSFLFMRTDGYYIVATALGCRNLMSDTENFLRNVLAWVLRRGSRVDQSGVPRREMRIVRWYSLAWLSGRLIALMMLVFVGIPLLWGFLYQFILFASGQDSLMGSWDFATIAIIGVLLDGGGLLLWGRSLYRGAQERRRRQAILSARATARAAEPAAPATTGARTMPAVEPSGQQ
ncbi:hypothetical protein SAMN05443287_107323 [Micromonospora phaseoli]|uniref:Peptide zinc metalloprotease protein n=1 Tax=Micromonospora phaseoli TaxID=1144548 RepID=A0A1H7BJW7_9ACTN|nr:hypothetical protein CLV64_10840 [Micromonospora phaseoli]GIJ79750.1 hypothetical protein Xph01_41820 [Micromonospora phaseoli]SEJ77889.1 hypothetical protein SAMN05443287_107323 [Micromonospora phaseoli]